MKETQYNSSEIGIEVLNDLPQSFSSLFLRSVPSQNTILETKLLEKVKSTEIRL